jgi:hypothetical protein
MRKNPTGVSFSNPGTIFSIFFEAMDGIFEA